MANNSFNIRNLINPTQHSEIERESRLNYLNKIVNDGALADGFDGSRSIRFSFLLFNVLLAKVEQTLNIEDLESVYYQLRSIDITNENHQSVFEEVWGIDGIRTIDAYYFYLATTGLLSGNSIKVRIDLAPYQPRIEDQFDWKSQVLGQIFQALILLIRKKDGLKDADIAIEIVNRLKSIQDQFEEQYLTSIEAPDRLITALELLGLYHVAKVITETATYLVKGYGYDKNLQLEITRHTKHAREALTTFPRLLLLVPIIERACLEIQKNSIWFHTANLATKIVDLCKRLASVDKLDLLPSQQQALSQNFLDAASNATVVTMPTSAGKTLLAEFSILQALALNPSIRIAYLVPTRALVNQVVSDLRSDFEGVGLSIEKTSKVNEIDPTESRFLQDDINILVSTPEKFDLLLRKRHPLVEAVSFIVVDEAHNIQEGGRGAKLELLLAIIKREKPNAKFLLLSPFIPTSHAVALKNWLAGGKNAVNPIQVLWKPSDKVIMGIRENHRKFELIVEPTAHSFLKVSEETVITVNKSLQISETGKKSRLFEAAAKIFGGEKNSILFLCWGKGTADAKAEMLHERIGDESSSELRELASKFITEEIGESTILSKVIRKGIAVHHAGLTEDSKTMIEHLVKKNEVKYICATTTIAQGINFPISTVFIDDTRKGGSGKRLSLNEFLNIAGRAGRTMVDNVGKIIFPYNSVSSIQSAKDLLSQQAIGITSALTDLILTSEAIVSTFSNGNNSEERAKLYAENESLGVLVQYLIHLLNVSEESGYSQELQDLFKDSYGYYALEAEDREKFLRICEALYIDLQTRNKGVLKFADKTGFSVPSVLKIMEAKKDAPGINSPESWNAESLFARNTPYLAQKIEVIASLREAKLGTDSDGPFSPDMVANVLKSWVNGDDISNISKQHPVFRKKEAGDRINDFVKYLTETTFKSSWGLSALESIIKSTNDDVVDNSHLSSLLYYGVNTNEAVPYRMIGVPRALAGRFSDFFQQSRPTSYTAIRKRISQLSIRDWDNMKPSSSKLNGAEWKAVTNILLRYQ